MTAAFVKDFGRIPMSTALASTLARAAEYASLQAHVEVTLEHLLLALTEDEDAEVVLATSNVNVGMLKSDVAAQLGTIEERLPLDQSATAKVSSGVMRILEAAAQAAQGRRNEINGAIVLAAIVGDGNSVAANLLRVQGLTFEAAIKALQSSLSAQRAAPAPAREVPVTQPPPVVREPEGGPAPGASTAEDFLARARAKVQSKSGAGRVAPSVDDAIGEMSAGSAAAPVEIDGEELAAQSDPFGEIAGNQQDTPQTGPPPPLPPVAAPAVPNESGPDLVSGDTWAPANPSQPPAPAQQPQPSRPPPPPPLPAAGGATPPQRPVAGNPGLGQNTQGRGQAPLGGAQQMPPAGRPVPGQTYPGGPLPGGARPVSPSVPHNGAPPMPPWPAPQQQQRRPMPAPQSQGGPGAPANARAGQYPPPPPHAGRAQNNSLPGTAFETAAGQREAHGAPRRRVEAGQLVENVPRTMQVGVPVLAEVSIAGANVTDLVGTLQGNAPGHRHDLIITKAMSVRLRAPDGGFFIETASPETQWIDRNLGIEPDDFARWRWNVTPKSRGRKRLQVVVSARTVGADGLAAETALPDQVIDVKIRANYKKGAKSIAGWTFAAVAGGLLARFGENIWETGRVFVASLMAGG